MIPETNIHDTKIHDLKEKGSVPFRPFDQNFLAKKIRR